MLNKIHCEMPILHMMYIAPSLLPSRVGLCVCACVCACVRVHACVLLAQKICKQNLNTEVSKTQTC